MKKYIIALVIVVISMGGYFLTEFQTFINYDKEENKQLYNLTFTLIDDARISKENTPNFFITDDEEVSGFSGCNGIYGSVRIKFAEKEIIFKNLGGTLKTCGGIKSELEAEFLDKLHKTDSFEFKDKILTLKENNKVLLKLKATKRKS